MFKRLLLFLILVNLATACEIETDAYPQGEYATMFYTPGCATINGYVILEGNNKVYVFQHEIEEEFQGTDLRVFLQYQVASEPIPLTAECTQAEVIIIRSLKRG